MSTLKDQIVKMARTPRLGGSGIKFPLDELLKMIENAAQGDVRYNPNSATSEVPRVINAHMGPSQRIIDEVELFKNIRKYRDFLQYALKMYKRENYSEALKGVKKAKEVYDQIVSDVESVIVNLTWML